MKIGKIGQSVAVVITLSVGVVWAGAESPTYKAGQVNCKGGDCSAIVMNDDGWGVIVEGKGKRKTRKAAEAKAEELNASGGEGSVVDPCFQEPETCVGAG